LSGLGGIRCRVCSRRLKTTCPFRPASRSSPQQQPSESRARTVGGRVTPAVIQDAAYIGYLIEAKAPEGPYFEVAVIHHTDCGSALLADEELRHGFAERSGYDPLALAELPVLDPAQTVRTDVERLLHAPQISPHITVSGHVYDLTSGLVTTIAQPTSPARH
jgi:carbonic anhydrase